MKLSSVLQRPPAMEVVMSISPAPVGENSRFFSCSSKRRTRFSPQFPRSSFLDARLRIRVKRNSKLNRFSSSSISEEELHRKILEEDYEDEEEEEEEDGEIISEDDESPILSLSVKPDRNMALLDEYELEEEVDTTPICMIN